ncbi:hypothetical protein BCR42DRAFT_329922 [Absidia repens]|uniref:Actin cortical patch SUR7/pH-response regulator pali n=1 Tax=Absidia repens TaxID=90262 RepID=A0A1X2ICH6_9FUNG|nr:hypothetical protein BCR42DRAFT_329922 [Absidia repens]
MVGFILILLCLVGGFTSSSQGLHFAKIQGSNVTATFGLLGYCTEQASHITCQRDDAVKLMPFMETVPNILNDTYPNLFTDSETPDADVYPESVAQPNHDPRIMAACILCLICGGAAMAIGICKIVFYTRVQDESYTRGFCALGAAVVALLLVAETTVMYSNGIDFLNMMYPNLQATAGPGMILVGIAFMVFFLSSMAYLQGCFSNNDDEGYEML